MQFYKATKLFICFIILFCFITCNTKQDKKSNNQKTKPLSNSSNIVTQSAIALSGELVKKINENGIEEAIKYCKLSATPITDSLSKKYNVSIKRSSLKIRNPKNNPNSNDSIALAYFASDNYKPYFNLFDGNIEYYYEPIYIAPMCLQCHGVKGIDIDSITLNTLNEYYPLDMATGYRVNELRGVWNLIFKK